MKHSGFQRLFCFTLVIIFFWGTIYSQSIPKPEDILGFQVGSDYRLATYHQAVQYFRELEKNSDRIRLFDAGQTSLGQTMTYAVISSPENLMKLEQYKSTAKRLSSAKGLNTESARKLALEGKAIVYIDGGLHASECAPAQHNIQLAYDMASGGDAKTERILNDVILVLVFANPDGMNLLADWYHRNVGTPYEVAPMPELYHVYAGHDNNRDSYLANLIETQNLTRLVNQEWYPVILYNHHQTAPFPARIWIPPNSEPTNPNVHPMVVRWQNLIGSAMGAAFDTEGKEGAISRIMFDTWFPGYVTQVVDSHNIISILTETALYRYATPHFYTVRDFPEQYRDLTMSAFYPSPWKGGWWRLKDAVDYCLTASKAVLDVASKYNQELMLNKYQMGTEVIERFRREPPYAWIIPLAQRDPGTVSLLLNRMSLLGIDIYTADTDFSCDGLNYPEGTLIIPMDQANGLFIKNIFEVQNYPDLRKYPDLWQGIIRPLDFSGSPFAAYDQMGWTLPLQFNADVRAANTPLDVPLTPQKNIRIRSGTVVGKAGYGYLLSHEENAAFTAMNRILGKGGRVEWMTSPVIVDSEKFGAGGILVGGKGISHNFISELAEDLDLKIKAVSKHPPSESKQVRPVRLGLYKSWQASADEGWTRFLLEKFEFPYKSLHDAEVRAGSLNSNFDVILFPSMRGNSILKGHEKGSMPLNYVGGITQEGVRNLIHFAQAGGTIIFINQSCDFVLSHFKIPVRNTLSDVKREDFVCSGSILRINFDSSHPLAFGMAEQAGAIFNSSFAFDILPTFDKKGGSPVSVAKYPGENPLMSGWIHGHKYLLNKSSILEVPYEKGRLILLGFPVQFRAQPYGTFRLLFNSIFYAGME